MVYSISLTKNLHENHTYSHNKSVACFFKYWAINRWIFSLIVHNNIRFRRTAETTKNHTNSEWQNGGITKIVTQWHLSYCSEFIIALSFWLTATIARCTATIYQLHRYTSHLQLAANARFYWCLSSNGNSSHYSHLVFYQMRRKSIIIISLQLKKNILFCVAVAMAMACVVRCNWIQM